MIGSDRARGQFGELEPDGFIGEKRRCAGAAHLIPRARGKLSHILYEHEGSRCRVHVVPIGMDLGRRRSNSPIKITSVRVLGIPDS